MNLDEFVGRYQIKSMIGQGGFAQVYHAIDHELQRSVALKISARSDDDRFNSIIVKEAITLAQLSHPSIVKVHDTGRDRGQPYVVMEYLESSLKDVIQARDKRSYRIITELVAEIAEALDHVHRRGILHRNLKPRVILLDATGHVRLSGFEVAVQKDEIASAGIAGTMMYMAPEQRLGLQDEMGTHTDVWGLGMAFYEALTGSHPFPQHPNIHALKEGLYQRSPVPLRQIDSSIPDELEQICLRCLANKAQDRYPSADKLAQGLRDWLRTAATGSQARVFISHSTRDREFIEKEIVHLLERNGIKTWYSKDDIQSSAVGAEYLGGASVVWMVFSSYVATLCNFRVGKGRSSLGN